MEPRDEIKEDLDGIIRRGRWKTFKSWALTWIPVFVVMGTLFVCCSNENIVLAFGQWGRLGMVAFFAMLAVVWIGVRRLIGGKKPEE